MQRPRFVRWVVRGATLALVFGMAVTAVAQGQTGAAQMPRGGPRGMGPGGPGGPPMGGGPMRLLMQLDLTDAQRASIRQLMEAQRQSGQSVQLEMRQAQQQLVAAIYGGTQENGGAQEIAARIAELQKQMLEADVKLQESVAPLLTDEQRQQLILLARQGPPSPPPPPPAR